MNDPSSGDEPARHIRVIYSEVAEADIAEAYEWLLRFGFGTAERWLARLEAELEKEASYVGAARLSRPISPDSPPDRDFYLLLMRSGSRRSSAWWITYELQDLDEDGLIDTLRVIRIRHASRQ